MEKTRIIKMKSINAGKSFTRSSTLDIIPGSSRENSVEQEHSDVMFTLPTHGFIDIMTFKISKYLVSDVL